MMNKVKIIIVVLLVSLLAVFCCSCQNKLQQPNFSTGSYDYYSYAFNVNSYHYVKTGDSIRLASQPKSNYTVSYANGLIDVSGIFSFSDKAHCVYLTIHESISEAFKESYNTYLDSLTESFSKEVLDNLKTGFADTDKFHYYGDYLFDEGAVQCYRQLIASNIENDKFDYSGIEGIYQMSDAEYTISLSNGKVYQEKTIDTELKLQEVGSYNLLGDFLTMTITQQDGGKLTARYLSTLMYIPELVEEDSLIYDKDYAGLLANVTGKPVRVLVNNFYYKGDDLGE